MNKKTALAAFVFALSLEASFASGSSDAATPIRDGSYIVDGYGYAVTVDGGAISVFDCSSVSRIEMLRGKIDGRGNAKLAPSGSSGLLARLTGNAVTAKVCEGHLWVFDDSFKLIPVDRLDAVDIRRPTKDPAINYEVFCRDVGEYSIAFLHRPSLDWAALCAANREKAMRASNDELFDLCAGMIRELRDGHTTISSSSRSADSSVATAFERDLLRGGSRPFKETVMARLENIGRGKTKRIVWGTIRGTRCGYMVVAGLHNMTAYSLSFEEEFSAVSSDVETAADYLSSLDAVILDLRINGGGYDAYAEKIASIFVGEKTVSCSVQYRTGALGDWSVPEIRSIDPSPVNCAHLPLAILVSPLTASAAEVLVLPLLYRPATAIVGERTAGCFSDALEKVLPNGWSLTLSNERYLDARGIDREQIGIEPNVPVSVRYSDFVDGYDPCVDAALRALGDLEASRNSTGDIFAASRKQR